MLSKKDILCLLLGGLFIAGGIGIGLWPKKPNPEEVLGPETLSDPPSKAHLDENLPPVIQGIKGDLAKWAKAGPDSRPWVVGDLLTLDLQATGALEYSWSCNGHPLECNGRIWTPSPERTLPLDFPGPYLFEAKARNAFGQADPLQKEVRVFPLKIQAFRFIPGGNDRFTPGHSEILDVQMAEPFRKIPYLFRFFMNGKPIKATPDGNPDDVQGQEWTPSPRLFFTFKEEGHFHFMVHATRATPYNPDQVPSPTNKSPLSFTPEDHASIPETIGVGPLMIQQLAFEPDLPIVGSEVRIEAELNEDDQTECRFGYQINNACHWILDDAGREWGSSKRIWIPQEPGSFKIKADLRCQGKDRILDFREVFIAVTARGEDF